MKTFTLSCILIIFSVVHLFAQRTIDASDIIRQINEGKPVTFQDATITGILDFTALDNRELVKENGGWFGGGNDQYESKVEVKIEFIDCMFKDDVLAYYNDDDATYIAHFEEPVKFEKCVFEEQSEFKYSEFARSSSFRESIFEEEANFKYAEFENDTDFSNCKFDGDANFKYAEYDNLPNYAGAVFDKEANFKYVEFDEGVNFEQAVFNDMANFKYCEFSDPLNIKSVTFNGEEDFKYTRINGQDFTSYLLNNQ